MKFSLAAQLLSPAFAAAIASPSSVSVAEVAAKKYDTHRDINAAATSRASRNLDSIVATSSKSSKSSSSYCPPEPTQDVQCGNVYNSTGTDEEVVVILGGNLLCDENITDADDSRNAALTLVGEKSVLNCQGYTISQNTVNIDGTDTGSAAALDCPVTAEAAGNSTELLRIKQECGLFFEFGVLLKDGASMVNCNIQKFIVGGSTLNGGEIKDSQLSLNYRGVQVGNLANNTVSKVVNSKIYNNGEIGIGVFQFNEDNSKVMIEDVTANNNQLLGMYLTGTGISVHNANIKNNQYGLVIGANVQNSITLAGDITATNNEFGFDTVVSSQGTVYVTGDVNLNRNEEIGLRANDSANLTITVGGSYSGKSGKSVGSGSLVACDNTLDIDNAKGSQFEGSDYTFDTSIGPVPPESKPCHPGCPSPKPDAQTQQQMASFMAGHLDPVRPAQEMEEYFPL